MSGEMKSTPPTSRPIALAARSAISRLSGWMTSVLSIAVPPVERLPVERRIEDLPVGRTRVAASRPAALSRRSRLVRRARGA